MVATDRSGGQLALRHFSARYDVTEVVDEPGHWWVAAAALLPQDVASRDQLALLCCSPGGGVTSRYFDLQVAGGGYSFAESATAAGFGCILVDNLGTGNSAREHDILISPLSAARANAEAFRRAVVDIEHQLCPGARLVTLGIGHSMGAMLTLIGQALTSQHVAVAALGFTTAGLPQALMADELEIAVRGEPDRVSLEAMAARRFRDDGRPRADASAAAPFPFVLADTDPAALQALGAASTNMLRLPGMLSLLPGNISPHIGQITVPVFLGGADHEPWHRAAELVPAFRSSADISFFTLTGAAHNHNVAPTRKLLWQRLLGWAALVTAAVLDDAVQPTSPTEDDQISLRRSP